MLLSVVGTALHLPYYRAVVLPGSVLGETVSMGPLLIAHVYTDCIRTAGWRGVLPELCQGTSHSAGLGLAKYVGRPQGI